jgi:hypothetical protein
MYRHQVLFLSETFILQYHCIALLCLGSFKYVRGWQVVDKDLNIHIFLKWHQKCVDIEGAQAAGRKGGSSKCSMPDSIIPEALEGLS